MKIVTIVLIACLISTTIYSQNSDRIKDAKGLVWFGLDFTQTTFRGIESSFPNLDDFKTKYFDQLNILILQEKEKYNLKEAFGKELIDVKITTVMERNKTKEMSNVLILEHDSIKKEQLNNVVSNYSAQSDQRIGLIFIVECLDKIDLEITIWVTLFDINTKEILFTKNLSGKALGIGVRNYWAGGIFQIIKQCDANFYTWLNEKN